MFEIEIKKLSFSFQNTNGISKKIFKDLEQKIHFDKENKIISIYAPFASGKSSLMKIISGIEKQTSGEIYFNNLKKSEDEIIPYLSTSPSSFPWLNVSENISFGMKAKNPDISKIIDFIGLKGYEDFYPTEDSLGFRFRISLGRALAVNPKLIVIDDSFKFMDEVTKSESLQLCRKIADESDLYFIYATSNIFDAINLGDSVLVFRGLHLDSSTIVSTKNSLKTTDEIINQILDLIKK
ncbi:MAG: hypothetical protein C0425_09730 [Chlorobiaceae bacterium]|nr:hypothetical protein [Chlorobiaceae bacterium]MBA4310597.1 hypothetical protein [Chlorobiaceae bacterium]